MIARRHLSRRRSLVALAAVLAIAATGCSGSLVGPAPVATVGDTDITRAELDERIDQYRDLLSSFEGATEDPQVAEILEQLGGQEYTRDASAVALELSEMINQEITAQAVEELGAEITDEQRDQAREELSTAIEQRGAKLEDLPKEIIDAYVDQRAGQVAIQGAVPDELQTALDEANAAFEAELRAVYDANPDTYARVCGYLLAVADEAGADDAVTRIEGGEPFSDVAADVSTIDPAAASQVQCYDEATIAQIFGVDPAAGDVLGPVEDGGQWVVLQVESLERAPFEEVRDDLAQNVATSAAVAEAEQAISDYLTEVLQGIAEDVTVDPRFGTWDATGLQVIPNPVTATTTTLPIETAETIPVETIPAGP